jgi:hypothetical protein
MDPNETCRLLIEGCADPSPAALRGALNEWIARGGFKPRVAIHPATDYFMMGAKYGTVVGAFRGGLRVELEVGGSTTGRVRRITHGNLTEVVS